MTCRGECESSAPSERGNARDGPFESVRPAFGKVGGPDTAAGRSDTTCIRAPRGLLAVAVSRLTTIAVLAFTVTSGAAVAAEPDGAKLYAERCSGCHGDTGGGDGPAAAALVPRPKNFHELGPKSADELRAIVKKGKPGTMMQPFDGVLSDAEIDAVVRHVQHFAAAPK